MNNTLYSAALAAATLVKQTYPYLRPEQVEKVAANLITEQFPRCFEKLGRHYVENVLK